MKTPMDPNANGDREPEPNVTKDIGNGRQRYRALAPADGLSKCQRSILTVLAQYERRTKNQVAVIAGYAVSSGNFNNALSGLRSSGFIDGSGEDLKLTAAGGRALGPVEPLPVGKELLEYWLPKLSKCERAIIESIHEYGEGSKEAIGHQTGYVPSSGNFNNSLSRLRTLELIEGRGTIYLNPLLRG